MSTPKKLISQALFILLFGFVYNTFAQNKEIPLWETIPGAIIDNEYQEGFRLNKNGVPYAYQKVSTPTLKLFLANTNNIKNPAVIICPGGGYAMVSYINEGDEIAKWLNSIGISAFVLKYRLPSDVIMKNKTIGPLQDAQEAIRTIRRNAKKWNIAPDKVGIIGFSAGGHLAATASTLYNDTIYTSNGISARPDFSILIYPVISMEDGITHNGSKINLLGENASKELIKKYSVNYQVNENTPPTFLAHSTNDDAVPVENSINYYLALKHHKVPAEMHLYENGGHGYGLGNFSTHNNWSKACESWLTINKITP